MYLVTGATGFVGGHMVDLLLSKGCKVRALVRNENKAKSLEERGVEIVVGDLTDNQSLKKAVKGVAGVFHIGATFREPNLSKNQYFEINSKATLSLLEFANEEGVEKFIYCSTNGVVGSAKELPTSEMTPFNPGDVYQESKAQGEVLVKEFLKTSRIKGSVIRPGMVYGFRDTRFLKIFQMIKTGKFFYVGKGNSLVHFIDVRDLVNAFWLAMNYEKTSGDVFLIGGDTVCTLKECLDFVAKKLSVKSPWLHIPTLPMYLAGFLCECACKPFGINPPLYRRRIDFFTKHRCFNTTHAKEVLGFKPAKNFWDELDEVLNWYQKENLL